VPERWATFDCYGTLVDWNAGIGDELARLFGDERREDLLARYHELEPVIQRDGSLPYRTVLARTLAGVADAAGLELAKGERDALGRSLPAWPVFPEVPAALGEARARGWRLAILSNSDRDFIEASIGAIGVPFELSVVAGEIGSYKPAFGHWLAFAEQTRADPAAHVHVGASLFHDIAPARDLGIPVVWINRLGEHPGPEPTRELSDLSRLPDTLDELVAAR
jgi:2-haloacid dehalogenase